MKLKITHQLLQVDLNLANEINTYHLRHVARLTYAEKKRIDQCQNENSALQMWVASVVSVKVLQCLSW